MICYLFGALAFNFVSITPLGYPVEPFIEAYGKFAGWGEDGHGEEVTFCLQKSKLNVLRVFFSRHGNVGDPEG